MAEPDSSKGDDIPRGQVETALRYLEGCHGDALRRPWSDEALAYYEAIGILEAAMDGELRPPDELRKTDSEQQLIQRSRDARDEGYAAATLLDEQDTEKPGLISRTTSSILDYLGLGTTP